MEKHINQELYHSGTGDVLYVSPKFVFEVEITRISKNTCELLNSYNFTDSICKSSYFSNSQVLQNGDIIVKDTTLVGAPKSYLIENNYIKHEERSN